MLIEKNNCSHKLIELTFVTDSCTYGIAENGQRNWRTRRLALKNGCFNWFSWTNFYLLTFLFSPLIVGSETSLWPILCPSVGQLVGWLVGPLLCQLVCQNFVKGLDVTLACSCRSKQHLTMPHCLSQHELFKSLQNYHPSFLTFLPYALWRV